MTTGSDLRATKVGVGEAGRSEVDGGIAVDPTPGGDLRATQVGVGEVGLGEIDGGVA